MPQRLQGKTALITGAAHGQGRSHAVRFAEEGANVIVTDLPPKGDVAVKYQLGSTEELGETVRMVETAGGKAHAAGADVRDRPGMQKVFDETADDFPELDIIVANAGITFHGRILETSEDEWNQMLAINLTGVFNTIQTFLPRMIATGRGGSIIIISSVAGIKGLPFFSAYCASKFGTQGLMAVLAQELAPEAIRVNTINPGPVETPMTQNDLIMSLFTDDKTMGIFQASFNPALPLPEGGFFGPEHISDAVVWLASDESKYVTGLAVPVDAGVMAR